MGRCNWGCGIGDFVRRITRAMPSTGGVGGADGRLVDCGSWIGGQPSVRCRRSVRRTQSCSSRSIKVGRPSVVRVNERLVSPGCLSSSSLARGQSTRQSTSPVQARYLTTCGVQIFAAPRAASAPTTVRSGPDQRQGRIWTLAPWHAMRPACRRPKLGQMSRTVDDLWVRSSW